VGFLDTAGPPITNSWATAGALTRKLCNGKTKRGPGGLWRAGKFLSCLGKQKLECGVRGHCGRVPDSELQSARTFGLSFSGAAMAFLFITVGRPGELRCERFDCIMVAKGTQVTSTPLA
jgi:hypothetical protein